MTFSAPIVSPMAPRPTGYAIEPPRGHDRAWPVESIAEKEATCRGAGVREDDVRPDEVVGVSVLVSLLDECVVGSRKR